MQFGLTMKPDMTVGQIVSLTKQAEVAGFEYGWIFGEPLYSSVSPVVKNLIS